MVGTFPRFVRSNAKFKMKNAKFRSEKNKTINSLFVDCYLLTVDDNLTKSIANVN